MDQLYDTEPGQPRVPLRATADGYLLVQVVGGGGGGGSSVTNLSTTVSPTNVVVASDTGTDATIPLADATNAGAMPPAAVQKLAGLGSASTAAAGDFAPAIHTHSLLMTPDERTKLGALPVAADLTTSLAGKLAGNAAAIADVLEAAPTMDLARIQSRVSKDQLLDLFPLPQMRSILDPTSANIAGATKPATVTISTVAAPGEMYGSAIKIDLPSGLNNQKVIIPILADLRGNYPKALPKMEWRVQSDNWSACSRLYFWACEDAAATKGRLWVIGDAGQSQFSFYTAAQKARWDGVYRTMQVSPYFRTTPVGSPSAWDETTPEYEVRSIAMSVTTTAACSIYINRICCPDWARGAMILQLDGCYALSYTPIVEQFKARKWPGIGSRVLFDAAEYMTDAQVRDMAANGWDIGQHIARADTTALTPTVQESELTSQLQKWRRFAASLGFINSGWRVGTFITNSGRYAGTDIAGVLLKNGITGSRGRASDAIFGFDPYDAATNNLEWGTAMPSGFAPCFGRYNRWTLDAGDGATFAARNTYTGSNLEKLVARCAAGADVGWTFFHRIQPFDGVLFPAVGNNTQAFVNGMFAHLDALVQSGALVMLSPSQLESITYERPGDIYLRWDGAWVSRASGSVVL